MRYEHQNYLILVVVTNASKRGTHLIAKTSNGAGVWAAIVSVSSAGSYNVYFSTERARLPETRDDVPDGHLRITGLKLRVMPWRGVEGGRYPGDANAVMTQDSGLYFVDYRQSLDR